MTYEADQNHLVLERKDQWLSGLPPIVKSGLFVHYFNEAWHAKATHLATFNRLAYGDPGQLTDANMERLQRLPEQLRRLDAMTTTLCELAAPRMVDLWLNSIQRS